MAKITEYTSEQLRNFASMVRDSYKKNETLMFTFEDWKRSTFSLLFDRENCASQYPKEIRIAPSTEKILEIINNNRNRISAIDDLPEAERAVAKLRLFKEIIQPERVFTLEEPILDPRSDTPIWFGSTLKCADLYIGYKNGDSSDPFPVKLADPEPGVATVHAKMSGGTGSGKSVTMHTLVCNLLLYYAPWEVTLYLADFKKVEFSKYSSPIRTPHVKIVAASENMTFVQSVMEAYDSEMARRQSIFQEVGCEKLEDFRKKFNMVMPRCLFLCDEFGQVKSNLKAAEAMGSTTTDEERQANERVLHRIGTLGRSMGMHMLISSQSLVGAFQDETDKQFGGGIALKVNDPSDSKSVIGNAASAYIRGKGKGYVNLNKAAGEEKDNVLVRIPYIDSELSDEDLESGRQTYLTETINVLKNKADELGFETNLFYYSDDALDSFDRFASDVNEAIKRTVDSPFTDADTNLESQIKKEVFLSETALSLAMGRGVTYSNNPLAFLDLGYAQGNNILISGNKFDTYALRLLGNNISKYMDSGFKIENYLISGDRSVLKFSNIEELLGTDNPARKSTFLSGMKFPNKVYNKIDARKLIYNISEKLKENISLNGQRVEDFLDAEGNVVGYGYWDNKTAISATLEFEANVEKMYGFSIADMQQISPLFDRYFDIITENLQVGNNLNSVMVDSELFKNTVIELGYTHIFCEEKDGEQKLIDEFEPLRNFIMNLYRKYNTLKAMTQMKRFLTLKDFPLIFIWIIGAENLDVITNPDTDMDAVRLFKYWTLVGPKYGIFTVMTGSNWNKAYRLVENFNYIIEKENKSFFLEIGMKASINIYKNTFQIHDRGVNTKSLVKEFKLD